MEAVQLQSGSRVHIVDRELRAAAAVEQHQGAPVLLGISALYFSEKFHCLPRHVLMLHAHRCISIITLVPELADVRAAEHVAIHKQSPALIAHQMGHQETGERKRGALFGISLPPIQTLGLKLRRHQRGDR